MKLYRYSILFAITLFCSKSFAQVDEGQLGGWYMYFGNTKLNEGPWGFQGDVQYRNWNLMGDMEQLLLRGGPTYQLAKSKIKFTLGYASITTGTPGESTATIHENRIYQEAFIPGKLGNWIYLNHRFRFEQRFVESADFKTRFRYAFFFNIPLTGEEMDKGVLYLAVYDELFIDLQDFFDRNRFYTALGYNIAKGLRTQFGYMIQSTDIWNKGQLQVSLHHSF